MDTLAGHRRRGYAEWCIACLIRHLRVRGKELVWGAVETNVASMRLAAKLGFAPVDRVFEPERGG